MTQRIDPARGGYAFANRFVNVVVRLPHRAPVTTAGRCGGMAYSVLDHHAAGRDVPSWPPHLFAPERVPPDGHVVADHLAARQLDSFRSRSALRFLTWSALPDADVGPVAGVRTRTRRELPGLLRALAEGRPTVLGMVVARNPLRAGDNHQVVATGFTRDATGTPTLTLLDPNTPRREVTLVETPDGWRASNGRLWRGFFRHAYAYRTPPPLPSASRRPTVRVRPGAPLALAHVTTGRLLVVDNGAPALRRAGATRWTPTPRTDPTTRSDDAHSDAHDGGAPADGVAADGAAVRLLASSAGSGPLLLDVAAGAPAVVAVPESDVHAGPDDAVWHVVVEGGGPWCEGSRVRLRHAGTGALLGGSITGPTCTFVPDASTWWVVGA